ncbi:PAS domain-containing protein [Frateuria soli]|uniref:PAS domain-containing protein n=1 Tax=Frateuria soli TaxID=1542730 RepID=UPI001E5825E8|nr:PAS domain-containing protein [Frateuria soli]UGB39023.1 PAS domain-containing protein [Frateuria soli]
MTDFEQIFEHAPTACMVLDREFRYVRANRAYLRITASPWDALEGRRLFDVFPDDPDDPARQGAGMLRASLERVLATGEADTLALIPYRVPRHTDHGVVLQDRYWSATHTPLFDQHGNVAWIVQRTEDVTELHQLRQSVLAGESAQARVDLETRVLDRAHQAQQEKFALERERRRLRELFEQAPGFVCILRGRDYVFDIANAAYRDMVGRQAIIGLPLVEALPEVAEQGFVDLLDQACLTGEPYVGRAVRALLERDGALSEFFLDFVYQPIHEPDGSVSGVFVLGHDVTDQVLAHRDLIRHREHLEELVQQRTSELAQAEAALHQAQKMDAVGRLTGGVAHDFNNLLQVIGGNLHLVQASLPHDTVAQRRLRNAGLAVERGAKLTAQLLAFARRQPLKPRVLDVAGLLHDMDDMLRRVLGEAIVLTTDTAAALWHVCTDPGQMENALLNLAINARDAMQAEGQLTLAARNLTVDDRAPEEQLAAGDYVVVSVSDNGSGMPQEVCNQAFEPFFTTKPEGHGTGLGLSMVYGFVKQSGGHVTIESAVGEGTTIRIYLPRAEGSVAKDRDLPPPPSVGGRGTVLVVEDDPQVRDTVIDLLGDLGYRVLAASNGEEASLALQSDVPIDLLFSDVVMPGPVKSTDLARQARERRPGIAVLYTSGYPRDVIARGGRLEADVELLRKPYSREDLAEVLHRLLHVAGNQESRKGAAGK